MNYKKLLSLGIMPVFVLASCSWWEDVENMWKDEKIVEKTPYNIEILSQDNLSKELTIEKVWRIAWAEEIVVNSKTSWKVESIFYKEGQKVSKGQTIVTLSDSILNLWLRVSKARNALDRANISYENTEISTNKAIKDAQLALEQAEIKYNTIAATNKNNLELAKSSMASSDLDDPSSQASIDLRKAEENIKKLELEYKNLLQQNKDQVSTMLSNTELEFISFSTTLKNLVEDSDKLLSVSTENESSNYNIRNYLWAKDEQTYRDARESLGSIINKKQQYLDLLNSWVSENNILDILSSMKQWYSEMITLTDRIDEMFNQSINTDTVLAQNIAINDWYRTSVQSQNAKLVSFLNSSKSFLNTYKTNEESMSLNIDLQKKQLESLRLSYSKNDNDSSISYNQTITNAEDNLENASIAVKNAKTALQNAKDRKNVLLKQETNAIESAKLSLSEANQEYAKLFIKAPISWTISDIYIDKWQEVSSASQVFKIINVEEQEIEVSLPESELSFVEVGKDVVVKMQDREITWEISTISNVADSNLNYKVNISLDETATNLWASVKVLIDSASENYLLPISIVNTLSSNRGFIYILDEEKTPIKKEVDLWKVWWDRIEVLTDISDFEIVTTDMSNFDENKFKIVIK